jgi:hypothetical protein
VGALGGRGGVALAVVAVVVHHLIGLHGAHLPDAAQAQRLRRGAGRGERAPLAGADAVAVVGVHRASTETEVLVRRHERRGGPVDGDAAPLRRPAAPVPDAQEHAHGLAVGEGESGHDSAEVLEHADGRVVDVEHEQVLVPLEVVVVEGGAGVEPQIDLLLTPAHAVHEDVGVQQDRLPAPVAQKLEVELVVLWPRGRHVERRHRPGGVSRRKLDPRPESPEQVARSRSHPRRRQMVQHELHSSPVPRITRVLRPPRKARGQTPRLTISTPNHAHAQHHHNHHRCKRRHWSNGHKPAATSVM